MKKATASVYLDSRPKKNGQHSVKIRITFNGIRRYYATGIDLLKDDFETIMYGKRRNAGQKKINIKISYFLQKAQTVLDNLSIFTFDNFEEGYLEQRNAFDSVSFAFDKYIDRLKTEKRVGTASSYNCAKNSLELFKKGLTFAEVTPTFLRKYENWMLENKKSISTVGIYLRSLRAIYNYQDVDNSLYPFGQGKNKYTIPKGKNEKKALTMGEIGKIYNYQAPPNSTKEMAKDYWLFLYLCNGMNVKDFCLLKWNNVDGDIIKYQRAKTKRSNRTSKQITIALKDEAREIIKKWGQPSIDKGAYIFPHIKNGMTAEKQRATYQQLTKTINKYMKQIGVELKLDKKVTTYHARHSFATVLKRSGAQTEMISELLGHSSVSVTQSYLDSFEDEQIQQQTDVLTDGFKQAN
ncbi:site-specific integrase [Arenibacter lacus]|uniref:site-specific integrase n=1 Tax=Arenibacter lacus TaxID=2608629 RepID=UPI00123C91E1|nr:site-specific integrase [Arenibacter lacus]